MKSTLYMLGVIYLAQVSTVQARKRGGQFMRRLFKVENFRFEELSVSPGRYVRDSPTFYNYSPKLYDLKKKRVVQLPNLTALPGLPVPPQIVKGKGYRYRRAVVINQGRYWRWYTKELVWYDGTRGLAGLFLVKEAIQRKGRGAPTCPGGKAARLVAKYGMYFCSDTRKYLKVRDYTTKERTSHFALIDVKRRRVRWVAYIAPGALKPLGVDPSGGHFYAGLPNYFHKGRLVASGSAIYGLNLKSRKVDWSHTIKTPRRTRANSAGSYGVRLMASPDFAWFFVWEYDEAHHKKRRGWLKNPYPRGYVVSRKSGTHFTIEAPVTCYGRAFHPSGRYLVIGSHQLRDLYLVDLVTRKVDKKITVAPKSYKYLFSEDGRHLFTFNFKGVVVYSFPGLKKVATIPLSSLYRGAKRLLVVERILPVGGDRVVMGVLKEHKASRTWSSDRDKGFVVFKLK